MDPPYFVSPREELNIFSWAWEEEPSTVTEKKSGKFTKSKFPPVALTEDNRNVLFHWGWSNGTAAVRGNKPFTRGHDYYWEIRICTAPYGTDVMVGVGTADVGLLLTGEYTSLLGQNKDSWGLSYTGKFYHGGCVLMDCGTAFGNGDVVGVHLDMWFGSLTFFVNERQLCLVNDIFLKKQALYPMMCSSSASTCLKLIYSHSSKNVLQRLCLKSLESDNHVMNIISKIPGLSKDCTKIFLKARGVKEPEDKLCTELEDDFICMTDTDLESSDGEFDFSTPSKQPMHARTTKRRVFRNVLRSKCVKCGENPMSHITRSSMSRLCKICVDTIEIDIYDGI